ncbi:hypothetical protein BD324DRAFT_624356 [Kockovaella imperatae]|uniref:NAD-dependent epimerase/dehydratase domain-containing protein n=1 Tax=Kockovaella imperatae TaxID=4999 RepID=A0A1Y1UJ24_9TREE|nr:hypothetical protein BD324DRAFT_624356 [Kockovaella imperatae]ORX38060.1 hypothetical protein BD324DRAFT_624356 [Kockovaella imperatae]
MYVWVQCDFILPVGFHRIFKPRTTMTKVIIIGGSGHVGTYLVPRLVKAGYDVTNVSRGTAKPYIDDPAWDKVDHVKLDRKDQDAGEKIAALKPEIIIDMMGYEPDEVERLVDAVRGKIQHYIFCSTVWVGGYATAVPTTEDQMTNPIDSYGEKKLAIERYLWDQVKTHNFPATSFRPGHIVGPWPSINPQGNTNLDIWKILAKGEELELPDHGLGTLHHIHADDCAGLVMAMIENRDKTIGEAFNNVSPQAVSLRWYSEQMFEWLGHQPNISYKPFDQWKQGKPQSDIDATWSHIAHSPCVSVEKAKRVLGFYPRYSSIDAIKESVTALRDSGKLDI